MLCWEQLKLSANVSVSAVLCCVVMCCAVLCCFKHDQMGVDFGSTQTFGGGMERSARGGGGVILIWGGGLWEVGVKVEVGVKGGRWVAPPEILHLFLHSRK